jgi:hypothetical protein
LGPDGQALWVFTVASPIAIQWLYTAHRATDRRLADLHDDDGS